MTLDEIIATANTAYDAGAGECIIAQIWAGRDEDNRVGDDCGDTLALFVVRELRDIYDAGAADAEQLEAVDRAMMSAYRQLLDVSVAFADAAVKAKAKATVKEAGHGS